MPLLGGDLPTRPRTFNAALVALLASGCYRVPEGRRAVESVTVVGAPSLAPDEVHASIATRASPKFLGLFRGVLFEYETFDPRAMRQDELRIERLLRRRGYYEAKVLSARVVERGSLVRVVFAVEEGEPVLIEAVTFSEQEPLEPTARDALRDAIMSEVRLGERFDEDRFAASEAAARSRLTSLGYAATKVTRHAEVDLLTRRARLVYAVDPGAVGHFGPIAFEGLGGLPEGPVRRIFGIESGQRYSNMLVFEGRQALLELGVFAAVDVIENLDAFEQTHEVALTVKTQPAKLRAVLLGAGLELDALKTDVHAQAGWQDANFLGGLRKLDVKYKPAFVLYPTRFPGFAPPSELLYEHRLSATLKQPAFVERRTTGLVRAEYNIYPLLSPADTTVVLGYHEARASFGLERRFRRSLTMATSYELQGNVPFNYIGTIPEVVTLLLSYVSVAARLDLRDDPVKPHRGAFAASELQVAGGPFGGDAADVRVQPELRGYIPLSRTVTLALRGSVGLLFPIDYGPHAVQVQFFRGFFGGGPSSNRGYPPRGIGPRASIARLSPAGQRAWAQGCDPTGASCTIPTGGLTLWETSAELRMPAGGPLSLAMFCDAADVSPSTLDVRISRPHLSCGGGARYDTPVGPIRLDLGVRIPGMQTLGNAPAELEPVPLFGLLPVAIALGIGEAY